MNAISPPAVDQAPLAFNPLDPAFIADPYPYYRRLRETAPVYKTPQGFWLATGYEDVALILRDKRFGKDFVGNMRRRYGEYLTRLRDEAYRDQVFAYVEKEDTPRPLLFQLDLLREVGFAQVDVLHKNVCFAAFGGVR